MKPSYEELSQRGWMPGPLETKESFEKRIESLTHFFSFPPEEVDHFLTDGDWVASHYITKNLFDFSPDWIVSFYSKKKLPFFQGGCTWIIKKDSLNIPLIQLHNRLEKGSLFRMYGRQEILSHESVHAVRMAFDEPLFEEVFAYRTSQNWLRRFFGPLFLRSWEASVFIALLLIPITIQIVQILGYNLGYFTLLNFIPALYFGYLFSRLLILQGILLLAKVRIRKFLKNAGQVWAILVRLTDREIFQFALFPEKKMTKYIKHQHSLRWKLLKEMYLNT